jgi:hypothetical protein
VRLLMWVHYCYLLALPALAAISAGRLGLGMTFAEVVVIVGIGPVLMFALFLSTGYTLPNSLPIALVVTLAVPLQIASSVMLFGGRSVWLFFAEDATVEIAAFVLGTMFIALPHVGRKHGWKHFVFLLVFAGAIFVGGTVPYFLLVWRGYGGLSLWLILFGTAFETSFRQNAKLYANAIKANQETGEFQELEFRFDGGIVSKLLGLDNKVEVIAPLQSRYKPGDVRGIPILIGIGSFILPFIALTILEIVGD